jgi:hypothetical protein
MAGTGETSPGIVPDRFHVQFYTITPGGKKPMRDAVMTLAQIEATAAANGWRAQVGDCVG